MRYIDTSTLQIDQNWLEKANQLLAELTNKTANERKAFLTEHKNQIWGKLKSALEAVCKKCWYCETDLLGRAPYHVDHFRPKNGSRYVDHDGYWWLAYSYGNYRLVCPTCNSSGKRDQFPLEDGCRRAECDADVPTEIPLLLDPLCQDDPKLLAYESDGKIIPRADLSDESWEYKRAAKSIEIYRLDEEPLREARRGLQRQLQNCLDLCILSSEDRLEERIKDLLALISPLVGFSAYATARLKAYKDHTDYNWVIQLIEAAA